MKKKSELYMVLATALLISSCSSFIYKKFGAAYTLPGEKGQIVLDGTYDLYVRAVTSEDRPIAGSGRQQRILGLVKDGTARGGAGMSGKKIIEIEYLWVSHTRLGNTTVLYISTVADRYQDRYSSLSFLGLDKPNAADFRIFLIGRICPEHPDQIKFYDRDGKHTDTWTIRETVAEIGLKMIEQKRFTQVEQVFVLDDALYNPLAFKKQNNWQLMFLGKNDTDTRHALPMSGNLLHYAATGNKIALLLDFKNYTVGFPESHVIYAPETSIPEKN